MGAGRRWYSGRPNRAVAGLAAPFSQEAICGYASEDAFESGQPPLTTVNLLNRNAGDRWVIQDDEGSVFYEDDELELCGWTGGVLAAA